MEIQAINAEGDARDKSEKDHIGLVTSMLADCDLTNANTLSGLRSMLDTPTEYGRTFLAMLDAGMDSTLKTANDITLRMMELKEEDPTNAAIQELTNGIIWDLVEGASYVELLGRDILKSVRSIRGGGIIDSIRTAETLNKLGRYLQENDPY